MPRHISGSSDDGSYAQHSRRLCDFHTPTINQDGLMPQTLITEKQRLNR